MPRKPRPIADQLRAAITKAEKRGITRYRIAKEAGIGQSTLSQFMSTDRQLRLDIAERIAEAIGQKLILTRLS